MILLMILPAWMPLIPASTSTAPMRPPNSAWDELDGSPNNQVPRFQMMAPMRPAKTIGTVTS